MTDCLLVGHNEGSFQNQINLVRSMGEDSGAWRDLNLAFIDVDGVPFRSMDIINLYNDRGERSRPKYSNIDFMWPTITYLVSYLARHGFNVDYVNLFQEEKAALRHKLEHGDVLAVAVTTTLYVAAWWVEEVIEFVRGHNQAAKVILGGPFIHSQAAQLSDAQLEELFELLGADVYVISQEGELALGHILAALKEGDPLASIENIAFRQNGRYVRTPSSIESNRLADNMVNYDLFPRDRFGEFVSVRTAKSCPFACSFCGFPQRAGKYKYENVDMVETELNNIRKLGTVTTITFIDDTFNVPMARFKEIMRMMIKNGFEFRWNSFLRSDFVDEECIDLMRQSGCEGVFLGVESGSDRILKMMNKTSRSEHYRRVVPALRDAGIIVHCNFIVGFPGETPDTIAESIDLIETARPDFFRAQLWYCDPTTPIWKRRDELRVKGSAFTWNHPTMDSKEAAATVERLFCQVTNSIWLPQQGFELWSVFYLQRKGMPLDRIKTFLQRFNQAIKAKLRDPHHTSVDSQALLGLAESSQFQDSIGLRS
jgi:anaerobic magnesium-protoporphyrin IX monomethyl ester cyclase